MQEGLFVTNGAIRRWECPVRGGSEKTKPCFFSDFEPQYSRAPGRVSSIFASPFPNIFSKTAKRGCVHKNSRAMRQVGVEGSYRLTFATISTPCHPVPYLCPFGLALLT